MIRLNNVKKKYGKKTIVDHIDWELAPGKIYGLIGYNGSGKTTLLKTIAGIFRADGGEILVDNEKIEGNEKFRKSSFLVTEELFFDTQSTPNDMRKVYRGYYPSWDDSVFETLMELSGLDPAAAIAGFSKGMQRQTGLILALSVLPDHLFLDETFDGLDAAKRTLLTEILKSYAEERQAVILITSHYLTELEGIIDEAGMIYDGSLVIPDLKEQSLENWFLEKGEVKAYDFKSLFERK